MAASLVLVMAVSGACTEPTVLSRDDVVSIAAAAGRHFLSTQGPAELWPVVFVSDEYLGVSLDSSFAEALGLPDWQMQLGHRLDVTTNLDIVRDGGLLLEFVEPAPQGGRSARLELNFSSTAEFGGALVYSLRRDGAECWTVTRVNRIWTLGKTRLGD